MANVSSGGAARVTVDGSTIGVQWRRKGGQWGPVKFYDDAPEHVVAVARAAMEGNAHVGWNSDEPSLARAMRAAGLTAREVAE